MKAETYATFQSCESSFYTPPTPRKNTRVRESVAFGFFSSVQCHFHRFMDVNVQVRILNTGPPNTRDNFDEDADVRPKGLCHVGYRPLYSPSRGYP
jgi:hypothetical protein